MRHNPASLARDPAGNAAVEFALIAPALLLLTFGIIGFGFVFGLHHGVQQLAAEAARASVAGLDDAERERLARGFVASHAPAYAFLNPARLRVSTRSGGPLLPVFEVAVAYDLSDTALDRIATLVAMPSPVVERRAVVQRGGY